MATKIDFEGTFRGEILESTLNLTTTKKPQWVARFSALEQWIDNPAQLQELGVTEPTWADVSAHGLEIDAFLMLFNSAEVFDDSTAMKNYQQLKEAVGWDGTEFDSLANGSFLKKKLLFRVGLGSDYTDAKGVEQKGKLQVSWIDAYDASPVRTLKGVDADQIKALTAKLKIGKGPVKAPVGKIAKPGGAPVVGKPVTSSATPAAVTSAPDAKSASPSESLGLPPVTPAAAPGIGKGKKKTEAPVAAPIVPMTQEKAWEHVCKNSNGQLAAVIQAVWENVGNTILGDRDPDSLTDQDWGTIAHACVTELQLTKK